MNKNVRAIYEELAEKAGLSFIAKTGVAYGRFEGFNVLINGNNGTSPFTPLVSFFAYREGEDVSAEECRAIRNGVDGIGDCKPTPEGINITVCMCSGKNKFIGYVMDSLKTGADFLKKNGYLSACPGCREDVDGFPRKIGGAYMMVCDSCYKTAEQKAKQMKLDFDLKKERIVLGILGAFLGSCIGTACIILLGHFGYVTAISGLVMAFATVFGYRLLSKKLTVKGGIISLFFMVVMTFLAHFVNYAFILKDEVSYTGFDLKDALKALPGVLERQDWFRAEFCDYLLLLYLYVFVGCVPFIVSLFRKKRAENQISSLGHEDEE